MRENEKQKIAKDEEEKKVNSLKQSRRQIRNKEAKMALKELPVKA
jgi:hypothetical protein